MNRFLSLAARTAIPALAVLALGLSTTARADFQFATDFNPNTSSFPDFDTGTYGYQFNVGNAPLQVTGLASAYAGASGNVRIYQDGSSTDIASVFVSGLQTTTSPNGNIYGYETLATPVTLNANTTYDIVWDNAIFGQAFEYFADGVSLNPDITLGGGISDFDPGNHPTGDNVGIGPYFGPSLEVASATPEPASIGLLITGGLTSAVFMRRKRKRK